MDFVNLIGPIYSGGVVGFIQMSFSPFIDAKHDSLEEPACFSPSPIMSVETDEHPENAQYSIISVLSGITNTEPKASAHLLKA